VFGAQLGVLNANTADHTLSIPENVVTKVFNSLGAPETTFSKFLQTISQNLFKVRE